MITLAFTILGLSADKAIGSVVVILFVMIFVALCCKMPRRY